MLVGNEIKKFAGVLVAALCLLPLGSCSKINGFFPFGKQSSNKIGVKVSGVSTKGSTISTNGADSHSTSTVSIKKDGFCMSAFLETENDAVPVDWYFQDAAVTFDPAAGEGGEWTIEGEPKWLNAVDLTFWFWDAYTGSIKTDTPAAGKIVIDDYKTTRETAANKLSFNYSLPESTAAGDKKDADNQHDLIFAHNRENRAFDEEENLTSVSSSNVAQPGTDSDVHVHFYHALAEVLFAVSLDDDSFDKDVQIIDIAIENVYSGGSCVYDDSKTVESFAKFIWTPSGTATNSYAQVWDTDFSAFAKGTNEPDTFGAGKLTWRKGTYTKESVTYSIYATDNKFFMIPQTLGTDAKLTVTFKNGDTVSTLSASIAGDVWNAGYYYKYKLKYIQSGENINLAVSIIDFDEIPVDLDF